MKLKTAVVCMEVMETSRGIPLALGLWLVHEGERRFFQSIGALAAAMVAEDLKPGRIPREEGWENCVDVPDPLYLDILVTMHAEVVLSGK